MPSNPPYHDDFGGESISLQTGRPRFPRIERGAMDAREGSDAGEKWHLVREQAEAALQGQNPATATISVWIPTLLAILDDLAIATREQVKEERWTHEREN